VGGEGVSTRGGQGQPCPLAAGVRLFAQGDVAGLLQLLEMLGQDGVGDADGLPDHGELGLVRRRQDGADLQTPRRVDDRIEDGDAAHFSKPISAL